MKIAVKRSHCMMSLEHNGIDPIPLQDLLCDMEHKTIASCMTRFGGIKARVADHLLLNRTTLIEKAKKYGFPLKKRRTR